MKKRILFLCTGNSCRSQIADGLVNHDFADSVEAFSAGTSPCGLNKRAVSVMAEIGIDISQNSSDPIDRYAGETFDYVITLCGDADETCPTGFGGTTPIHIAFPDPPISGNDPDALLETYRRLRDDIRKNLGDFFRNELNTPTA